jgi:hypothetical protein
MVKRYSLFKDFKTKDIIIPLLIIALPFLFYTYRLAPDLTIWETKLFTINAGSWESAKYYIWIINIKLLLIFSLLIWFITCKHWWKNVILIPFTIELLKLRSIFDESVEYIDEIEFFYSLPITVPIILFILFLSKKIGYYSQYSDLHNEINQEVEKIIEELNIVEQRDILFIKNEFEKIKNEKSKTNLNDYQNKLLRLRKCLPKKI